MRKIIELDDHFPKTGEPTMVVLAREGRSGWLVESPREKRAASDAFEYIKTVSPRPGHTIVLVNALGTYEYYDINRNGDGFNERPYRVGQPALCGHPKCQPARNDGWVNRDEIVTQHYKTFERGGIYKHHVNKDPKRSLGRVEMAFFNAEMHRIELLLEIRNELDAELIQRINDGEFPAVSMGCHVRWDVCLRCGHRAPTRKEYCPHALDMRAIDPLTGEVNGVLNPSAGFFDISFVFRPADRTGFMLKKVAEEVYVVRGSCSLGEKASEYEEKRALARKLSDIQKELAGDVLAARTAPEASLARAYRSAVPADHGPAVPDSDIDALSEHPIPAVLSTLAEKGAALTASEFCRLFLRKVANVRPSDEVLDRFVALHPVVMEALGTYPAVADKLAAVVELSGRHVNAAVAEKLAAMGDWVRHRTHSQLGRPVGGPGYLTDAREAPRTDLLTMTDPNTGHLYTTTRGAAMAADRSDSSAVLGTALGLSGLYGLGLYGLGRAAGVKSPIPAAAAGLGLGVATAPHVLRGLEAYRNPQYLTDQGVRVSGGTEFKMASLFDKLAADYAERVPPAERSGNTVRSLVYRAKLGASLAGDEADVVWRLFHGLEKSGADAAEPPTLDPGTFAVVFGDLILNP